MPLRSLAGLFLTTEAAGATVWWGALAAKPEWRGSFKARGSPDATLFAFAAPDVILFVGAALAAAYGIARRRRWGHAALCVHAGAAAYAGLYCWSLAALSGGDGLLGALFMTPSLFVPGLLAWALARKEPAA